MNCRRCKVFLRADVVVPVSSPETTSSGKKTNVGAVVGFTFLLVFIVLGIFVFIYRKRKSTSWRMYTSWASVRQQQAVVQLGEHRVDKPAPELIVGPVVQGQGIKEGRIGKEVGGGGEGGNEANKLGQGEKVKGQMGKVDGKEGNKQPQGIEGVGGPMGRVGDREGGKQPQGAEGVEQMGRGVGRHGNKRRQGREGNNKRGQGEEEVRQKHGEVKDGNKRKQLNHDDDDVDVVRQIKRERIGKQPVQDGDDGRQYKRRREENGKGDVPREGIGEKQELNGNRANGKQGNSLGLPKKYTYDYLRNVTNNFDPKKKIGGGGFGIVYKARLPDGMKIAVKCLKVGGIIDDFKNEVEALGKADHPNLVKLTGYCDDAIMKILVYEYMRNGSLEKWIFHTHPKKHLTWAEMKNIIQGIAQGLVYLHETCKKTILHRDLKPQNVILDENKNAKICDFGLAKLLNKDQTSTSTNWAGTRGYMAPEVMKDMRISEKVDVYSFGIVALEVVFGKHYSYLVSSNRYTNREEVNLNELVKNMSEEMRRNGKEIEKFGKIAVWCLRENPVKRPTMSKVLSAMLAINEKARKK